MRIRIAKISILLAYISMAVLLASFFFSRKVTLISAFLVLAFMITIVVCLVIDVIKTTKEDKHEIT